MMDKDNPPSRDVINYGKQLSNLVFIHTVEVDKLIKDRSKNWDFDSDQRFAS